MLERPGLRKEKKEKKTVWKRFTQKDQPKPDKNKGNQSKTGSKSGTTTFKPNQEEASKSGQAKQTKARDKGGSKTSFRDMMSPEEAARYDEYWGQGAGSYRNVKLSDGTKIEIIFNGKKPSTRQRLQAPPGTKSITDVKYGKNGEMYYRETIFDEYGRRIGNNDYSDHGRPNIPSHTIPHHHPNSPNDPSHHGDGVPGLHPNTPK